MFEFIVVIIFLYLMLKTIGLTTEQVSDAIAACVKGGAKDFILFDHEGYYEFSAYTLPCLLGLPIEECCVLLLGPTSNKFLYFRFLAVYC